MLARGQFIISGTVYDSTKLYAVPGVVVKSTGGTITITDSLGGYHISVKEDDSLSFFYASRPTQKFPVRTIPNYMAFDISLQVHIIEKYKVLKEVRVFSNSYRQDSLENRSNYAGVFGYHKPGIRSTYTPGASAGLDLDELIKAFQFRKNKEERAFQKRLIEEEQEKYINYRFSTTVIKRVTGLSDQWVEQYRMLYRPSYEFLSMATELEFYEYILSTSAKFKRSNHLD